MIEDVRKADFVVVNPDHIAVAVRYDRDADAAPVVVARGERLLAERIKQVAREFGVPIYRDVGLARALHELPPGDEIPEALYEAVAEILRVLWEMDRRPDSARDAGPASARSAGGAGPASAGSAGGPDSSGEQGDDDGDGDVDGGAGLGARGGPREVGTSRGGGMGSTQLTWKRV